MYDKAAMKPIILYASFKKLIKRNTEFSNKKMENSVQKGEQYE